MGNIFTLVLDEFGAFDVLIPESAQKASWDEAKRAAKAIGKGYRLPLDFELEELFKSSLFRGIINNSSYWSGTETAKMRARSQKYRNGGDFRALWYQHPGDIEDKNSVNYFFFIRKSKRSETMHSLNLKILELSLYDSLRKKYHFNNYTTDEITRKNVFDIFKLKGNWSKKMIMTIKWGRIRKPNLNLVQKIDSKTLSQKIAEINKVIGSNNEVVFLDNYLKRNSVMKINGIGLAFITKYLYFYTGGKKFLIYDRWMKNLHYAMLLDNGLNMPQMYFKPTDTNLLFTELKLKRGIEGLAYQDFNIRFKKIYKEVNSELKLRRIKPFKNLGEFEAFMFGEYEKEYHSSNPRKLISDFIVKKKELFK